MVESFRILNPTAYQLWQRQVWLSPTYHTSNTSKGCWKYRVASGVPRVHQMLLRKPHEHNKNHDDSDSTIPLVLLEHVSRQHSTISSHNESLLTIDHDEQDWEVCWRGSRVKEGGSDRCEHG